MSLILFFLYLVSVCVVSSLVFIFVFYDWTWKSLSSKWKCRKLPSPEQNPIFGIGLQIISVKHEDLLSYFGNIWRKVGDVISFDVLGVPHVCLMKPEDIELIFNNSQHITKAKEYDTLVPWLCEGLLTSTGKKWHTRRRMLTPTFHFKILENFLPIFNKNANLLVRKISTSAAKSASVDIDSFISLCTLDVICETAMGVSLDCQLGEAAEYVAAIRRAGEIILLRNLTFWMYNAVLFNTSPTGREFRRIVKFLHGFTEKVIKERKELHTMKSNQETEKSERSSSIYKQRKSFLDCLIEMQKENPKEMTDLGIREEVDTFMFEGHDTTSAALTWAIFMIAAHPEVQQRIHEELEVVFGGDDREASFQDLNEMHYLEMVIKETLRLYPSVPYIARFLTTPVQIGKHHIPQGTNITIIPYLVHRNPKIFEDPEKFDPERFCQHNIAQRHPYSYIPFSAGYRNCIGQKFAMLESKVVLSSILRKFQVHSSLKKDDVKVLPEVILRPTPKIYLSFRPINDQP